MGYLIDSDNTQVSEAGGRVAKAFECHSGGHQFHTGFRQFRRRIPSVDRQMLEWLHDRGYDNFLPNQAISL